MTHPKHDPAAATANRNTLHVLIVEDDKITRIVLRRILESIGDLEVSEAVDGQSAWEMLDGGLSPDFCFLDINTPRLNGLELLKRIRSDHRLAPLKVCFCTVVRDREIIARAAVLQPDYYLLKPYTRAAIEAQVNRTRAALGVHRSIDSAEAVCARLGINEETYLLLIGALIEKINALLTRIPSFLIQADVHAAGLALDEAKSAARNLGAHRVFDLVENISGTLETNSALLDQPAGSKEEMAANLQQWMYLSSGQILPTLRELRGELQALERLSFELANPQLGGQGKAASVRARQRAELDVLAHFMTDVFKHGKLLATGKNARSRSLNVPVKASILGERSEKTLGALTQKLSFTLTILDEESAEAIENCRKINDLVKLLSFPLGEGERWIPEPACGLLSAEIASRNEQGVMLLREAIGNDFTTFLRKQEEVIRENLNQLYRQFQKDGQAPEEQVQATLQEVRQRFAPVLEGRLTPQPVFSVRDIGDLSLVVDDSKWGAPYSLLHGAAWLFRTAATDSSFDRLFKFSTFDRRAFLQAMNVFGDAMADHPEPKRAALEKEQLEAIEASPATPPEKCLMIWSLIKEAPLFSPAAENDEEKPRDLGPQVPNEPQPQT